MLVKSAQIKQIEDSSLKKPKNTMIPGLTVVSVIVCGCPGAAMLFLGIPSLLDGFSQIVYGGGMSASFIISYLLTVGFVCLSGIFLLISLSLVIYLLMQRNKKLPLEELEPTGVSKDDPIPPTH